MDDAKTTISGIAFQIFAMATGKAQLPTVDSLKEGTARWLVAADHGVCRYNTSAVRVKGPRYSGQCDGVLCRLAWRSCAVFVWITTDVVSMVCSDEANHVHELSTKVCRLLDTVHKQRDELRSSEHEASQKNAELEMVSCVYSYPCMMSLVRTFPLSGISSSRLDVCSVQCILQAARAGCLICGVVLFAVDKLRMTSYSILSNEHMWANASDGCSVSRCCTGDSN